MSCSGPSFHGNDSFASQHTEMRRTFRAVGGDYEDGLILSQNKGMRCGAFSDHCQREDRFTPIHSQIRRWASSISASMRSAGRLTNWVEMSVTNASNRLSEARWFSACLRASAFANSWPINSNCPMIGSVQIRFFCRLSKDNTPTIGPPPVDSGIMTDVVTPKSRRVSRSRAASDGRSSVDKTNISPHCVISNNQGSAS